MKKWTPLVSLLVLIVVLIYGHFRIPSFDSYLIMIALISFLVIAHELGHFYVAKRVGVKVERFGFGLPIGPTLWEKKFGETTYCIHAALLGGYVGFADDDPDSDLPPDSPRRFENKSIPARTAIAVAGVTVNLIVGYILMVIVIGIWGYPGDYHFALIKTLSPHSPAALAGLRPGDVFLKAGDKPIQYNNKVLTDYLTAHKKQPVMLTIERNHVQQTVQVTPDAEGRIEMQISLIHSYEPVHSPIKVLGRAFAFLEKQIKLQFKTMGEIITLKRSVKELSGPIGIIRGGGMMIQQSGAPEGLTITAIISTILAIMNILPIPMLDGGHLLFMFFEKVQGHPLKKEIQERVIQYSFFVLMGLMVFIIWNDISNIITH